MLNTIETLDSIRKQAEPISAWGKVYEPAVLQDVLERVRDRISHWDTAKTKPEALIAIFMQTAKPAEAPVVAAALVRSVTENQDRLRVAKIALSWVSADDDRLAVMQSLVIAVIDSDLEATAKLVIANVEHAAAFLISIIGADVGAAATLFMAVIDMDARAARALYTAVLETDASAAGELVKAAGDLFKAVIHSDVEAAAALFTALLETDARAAGALYNAICKMDVSATRDLFKAVMDEGIVSV